MGWVMKPVLDKASQLHRKRLNPKLFNMEMLHRLRYLHTASHLIPVTISGEPS